MIDLESFAKKTALQPQMTKLEIVAEQIVGAMGGISFLYEAKLFEPETTKSVETDHAFASVEVPYEQILEVIGERTGVGRSDSAKVLGAIEDTLRTFFVNAKQVQFECLGTMRARNPDESKYRLEFRY